MPRTVNHAQRRHQITDGLIRLAARDGLHAVTLRGVAAEAGVSLRLVQYYFHSKAELMLGALRRLEHHSHERWARRLEEARPQASLRALLATFCAEALPTDGQSRTFHLLWLSYAILSLTDPGLPGSPALDGPNRLERQLVEALEAGQSRGELRPAADPRVEAARLLALAHGLGTSVLLGQRTPESAMALLNSHLDALLSL